MNRRESIEEEAALWLTREDRGLAGPERVRFEEWLAQSTANKVAFYRLKATWQRMDRLSALRQPEPARPSSTHRWQFAFDYRAIAAAALLTVGIGAAGYFTFLQQSPSGGTAPVYATRVGQQQTVKLADGTKVELNTATRLQASLTRDERVVRLDSGEAYFDVAHDAGRPFVVFVGNRKITDIGTKFSVRRNGDNVEVVVEEGRVRVDVPNPQTGTRAIEAGASNVIVAQADGALVVPKSPHDIADRLSWRQGMLVFDQETLGEAAAEFNRYSSKRIIVVGPARDLRIGGRIRPDNVETFLALIKEGFGLKIQRSSTEIVVSE